MKHRHIDRRQLLQGLMSGAVLGSGAAAGLGSLSGCAGAGTSASKAQVVVVGGGYGGATAAKYVRLLSDYSIDVMLIEPNRTFVSCPVSNLVLSGQRSLADITSPYAGLGAQQDRKSVV